MGQSWAQAISSAAHGAWFAIDSVVVISGETVWQAAKSAVKSTRPRPRKKTRLSSEGRRDFEHGVLLWRFATAGLIICAAFLPTSNVVHNLRADLARTVRKHRP